MDQIQMAQHNAFSDKELQAFENAKNLLCIRLDALGDLLMSAPAIRALKNARKDRHLTLLTSPSGAIAAPYLAGVDATLIFEAPWMKASSLRTTHKIDQDMIDLLRDAHFDGAVIFTVFSQNPLPAAYLCYLADIPWRAAYCRENPYQLLTHWCREIEPEQQIRHEVRRQLDLVAMLGTAIDDERMHLTPAAEAIARVDKICKEIGLDREKPWLIMHPGATALSRRYPAEKFAHVARLLVEKEHTQVVFTGSADERSLLNQMHGILPKNQIFDLMGTVDFAGLVALISVAPLLISNNTAPVHIAASVGTPVVDLYALTNPQHTPWKVSHRLLCKEVPCMYCYKSICPYGHQHCLTLVTPEEVVSAVIDLISKENLPCIR